MARKHTVINLDEKALNIFTDGSSYSRPRRGGFGMRYVTVNEDGHPEEFDYLPMGYKQATNNEMELLAVNQALEVLRKPGFPIDVTKYRKVVVYTDSMYVADNFNNAKYIWPKNQWHTASGNPVAHTDLWKNLIRIVKKLGITVQISWHRGHSRSNPHNRAVDKLAKSSALGPLKDPRTPIRVRRKQSQAYTERGSIGMEGQKITIRIITDQILKGHKGLYKYKYEVLTPSSRYVGKVDEIYSSEVLKAGHRYYVRLNNNTRSPRVEKVYRELG